MVDIDRLKYDLTKNLVRVRTVMAGRQNPPRSSLYLTTVARARSFGFAYVIVVTYVSAAAAVLPPLRTVW